MCILLWKSFKGVEHWRKGKNICTILSISTKTCLLLQQSVKLLVRKMWLCWIHVLTMGHITLCTFLATFSSLFWFAGLKLYSFRSLSFCRFATTGRCFQMKSSKNSLCAAFTNSLTGWWTYWSLNGLITCYFYLDYSTQTQLIPQIFSGLWTNITKPQVAWWITGISWSELCCLRIDSKRW